MREACCAQDDQLGPLEATYDLADHLTLADLVQAVTSSRFLQYSSTHTTLTGFAGATPFATVFSGFYLPGRLPQFSLPATTPLADLLAKGSLTFRF